MSDKAKKQASEVSFVLSRWFRRVSTMKPSTLIVTLFVLGGSLLLLGGIVYDVVNQPLPAIYANNRFYFLYPQLSEQFLFDTVVSVILYAAGFIGLLAIYQSARHSYNPRSAYMTMVVGATLLLISYIFLEYFIRLKASGL
jgi:hypothetical protein